MCDNGIDFMGKLRQKFKIKPMCFYRRSDLESDISNHMWHITHIREVNALITQMIDFFSIYNLSFKSRKLICCESTLF